MLPKNQRLNLKTDFKWVASGKRLESKFLKLFFKMGENQTPRAGIAVSSKIFSKATDRNRARRLIAQAFQSIVGQLPSTINIVALPKAGVLGVKSSDVLSDLANALKNERIIP